MLKALLISVALVVGAHSFVAPRAAAPQTFSLMLESTPTGWAARCDTGCRWQRLSFGCERACGAIIDANGVHTVTAPPRDSAAFRFTVERTARGVRATGRTGTAWEALGWTCMLEPCRARVNTFGVSGIDTAR